MRFKALIGKIYFTKIPSSAQVLDSFSLSADYWFWRLTLSTILQHTGFSLLRGMVGSPPPSASWKFVHSLLSGKMSPTKFLFLFLFYLPNFYLLFSKRSLTIKSWIFTDFWPDQQLSTCQKVTKIDKFLKIARSRHINPFAKVLSFTFTIFFLISTVDLTFFQYLTSLDFSRTSSFCRLF